MAKRSAPKESAVNSPPQAEKEPLLLRLSGALHRRAILYAAIFTLIGCARIASTWTVFNHTSDEPAHISCGMEWLDRGTYKYEAQHPPLTRVAAAIGPYLLGRRSTGNAVMNDDGLAILYDGNRYESVLSAARAGSLFFFALACSAVYLWASRVLDRAGAVLSVAVFSTLPPVLAHAGLATTDMGLAATFALAMFALVRLVNTPSLRNAAILGIAVGFTLLSKHSALAYLPAAALLSALVFAWRLRSRLRKEWREGLRIASLCVLAIVVAAVVVWAGFRFSYGPVKHLEVSLPAPELFEGIEQVRLHNQTGHPGYFLGTSSHEGWWLFFPALLFYKTPIPALILLGIAFLLSSARRGNGSWPSWPLWTIAAGVIAFAMTARINIGLRHILPVYPFLAVIAGGALLWLARSESKSMWKPWAACSLFAWLALSSSAAHPDYLPYFNAFAGEHPENIVVDSDLDWGQDLKRLATRLQQAGATSLTFTNPIPADLDKHGFPQQRQLVALEGPDPGWNAISLTHLRLYRLGLMEQNPNAKLWPDLIRPTEMVGKSIRLYYVPPRPLAPLRPRR